MFVIDRTSMTCSNLDHALHLSFRNLYESSNFYGGDAPLIYPSADARDGYAEFVRDGLHV